MTYIFPATKKESSYLIICDIYPIDNSLEILGNLKIQDYVYNLTTVNSAKLRIIRDKILIQKVLPSSHIHVIPNSTLQFQIYLNEPVESTDVKNALCRFYNEYNRDWYESKVIFIERRLLNCSISFPSIVSRQLIMDYDKLILQIIVDRESEVFSDT